MAGFTGPSRFTGLGNQIPDVLGGELPHDIWMHGGLLAGVDLREPVSSWHPGIGGRPTMERPLAIAGRESPG